MNISTESYKLARRDDPTTSKRAAIRVDEFSHTICAKIYQELKKGDGTYEQLANRLALRPDQLCRRLPDLQRRAWPNPQRRRLLAKLVDHNGYGGRCNERFNWINNYSVDC